MNKVKNLVPPLELCKLIPAGEFADSALCWVDKGYSCVLPDGVIPPERHPFVELRRYTIQGDEIPAPTLQEIMSELPACDCYRFSDKNEWTVLLVNGPVDDGVKSDRPATAALKVWLKLKGIEE